MVTSSAASVITDDLPSFCINSLEYDKNSYSDKNAEFKTPSGMQTPESLGPRTRLQLVGQSSSSQNLFLDTVAHIFYQFFEGPHGIQIGHFAGAIVLMWFTPWDHLENIFYGKVDLSSMSLCISACFLRYTKYLLRIARIQPQLLHLTLFYIYRFRQRCQTSLVGEATSEARLLLTAISVADKFENDVSYTTATWAKLGKIEFGELKKMELEFLTGIDFNLHVTHSEWINFQYFLKSKMFPLIDRLVYI